MPPNDQLVAFEVVARDGQKAIARYNATSRQYELISSTLAINALRDVYRILFYGDHPAPPRGTDETAELIVDLIAEASSVHTTRDGGVAFVGAIRCLIGNHDLHIAGSEESAMPFSGKVRRFHDTYRIEQLKIGDQKQSAPIAIGDLRLGVWGTQTVRGGPSHLLQRLGISDAGWNRQVVQLRFAPRSDVVSATAYVQLEHRVERRGDEVLLPDFGLQVLRGDWLTLIQRRPRTFSEWPEDIERDEVEWIVELSYSEPHNPPGDLMPYYDSSRVLASWNRQVQLPFARAIQTVQNAQQLSFAPQFAVDSARKWYERSWLQLCSVVDRSPHSRLLQTHLLDVRSPTLQPLRDFWVPMKLPGFASHSGQEPVLWCLIFNAALLQEEGTLSSIGLQRLMERDDSARERIVFGAVLFPRIEEAPMDDHGLASSMDELRYRIGSLDLTMGRSPKLAAPHPPDFRADNSTAVAGLSQYLAIAREFASRFEARFRYGVREPALLDLDVRLPLQDIRPGGQDDLIESLFVPPGATLETAAEDLVETDFVREPPIVIPLAQRGQPGPLAYGAPFVLIAHEQTGREKNRTLRMTINERRELPPTNSEFGTIVVDRQPMLVAKVIAAAFKGVALPDDPNTREVGTWNNDSPDGAHWEIRGGGIGYTLMLPPQAMGETMVKAKAQPDSGEPSEFPEGGLADYRFSPPAQLHLLPYFRQRFAEAAWNLRRGLGFAGQRDPGARVRDLNFELLYGMHTQVTAAGLRLSELSSLLGNVPGRLSTRAPWSTGPQTAELYATYRRRWGDAYSKYLSRLSVLIPRDDARGQDSALVLEKDVVFHLRSDADLRYPIPDRRPPADSLAPDPRDPSGKPLGLAGGVSCGFESAATYELLWKEQPSTGGKLARVAFSSLGGWGSQKAVFGLTTIHSNTSMGRLSYYSLERIGRIGNLWNLAKHVIVYERTVVPSEQFVYNPRVPPETDPKDVLDYMHDNPAGPFPRPGPSQHAADVTARPRRIDDQDLHLGRPLLRKVREYVEILEPIRRFPDNLAPAVTRGCLAAVEFKTTIIAVNGHRLRDLVDGENLAGYTIPLWDEQDAAEKPMVYPRPQVLLACASAESADQTVPLEMENPGQLLFYTSTQPEDQKVSPSEWAPVSGIDFPDVPVATPPSIATFDESSPEDDQADDLPVQSGFEAFTYGVFPSRQLVNLVAGRVADATSNAPASIGAAIRNLTFNRAQAIEIKVNTVAKDVSDFSRLLTKRIDNLTSLLDRLGKFQPNDAVKLLKPQIVDLLSKLPAINGIQVQADRLLSGVAGNDWIGKVAPSISSSSVCDVARNVVRMAITNAHDQSLKAIDAIHQRLIHEVQALANTNQLTLDAARGAIHREFGALTDVITRVSGAVGVAIKWLSTPPVLAINETVVRINRLLDESANQVDTFNAKRAAIAQTIKELGDQFDNLRREINLAPSIARPLLTVVEEQLREIEKVAGQNIDLHPTVNAAKDRIAAEAMKLTDAIDKNAEDLRRLNTESAALGQNFLDRALREIDSRLNALSKALSPAEAIKALDEWRSVLFTYVNTEIFAEKDQAGHKVFDPDIVFDVNLPQAICRLLDVLGNFNFGTFTGLLSDPAQHLKSLLDRAADQLALDDLKKEIERVRQEVMDFDQKIKRGVTHAFGPAQNFFRQGDKVLRMVRVFGDSPVVQGLDFNRKRLGYYFDEAANEAKKQLGVVTTPVLAMADRFKHEAADKLRALRLRIPCRELLDRCIPDELKSFDVSSLFPSFAGMELGNLFHGLKMPEIAKQNVVIKHGFDREALRAWLTADVQVPVKPCDVFSLGPIKVRLNGANFEGHVKIEGSPSGGVQRKSSGSITGDWEITLGGSQFVTFTQTALKFDDGKLNFHVAPDRIRLSGIVKVISDIVAKVGSRKDGFSLQLLVVNGIPAGIAATLALPIPDTQAGTTGISGLTLHAGFELRVITPDGKFDFSLGVFFALAEKAAPFTITIFILGGGGYLLMGARYTPGSRALTAYLSLSINASAMLAIAIGPIKGSVYIGVGITAEFEGRLGGPSALAIGAMLLLKGEVDVAGLITVTITLLLELKYITEGGSTSLLARGTLSVRVKICWCFTFRFSKSIEFRYGVRRGDESQQVTFAPLDPVLPEGRRSGLAMLSPLSALAVVIESAGGEVAATRPSTAPAPARSVTQPETGPSTRPATGPATSRAVTTQPTTRTATRPASVRLAGGKPAERAYARTIREAAELYLASFE